MKQVGVHAFRDQATAYLSGREPCAVTKRGRVIGFYFPVKRDHERIKRTLDRLGETAEAILEETGMTEDELADFFDFRRPLPD